MTIGNQQLPDHPRLKAGFLNKFLFIYIFQVIRYVWKKDYKEDTVHKVLPEFKSDHLGEQFEKFWKESLKKSGKKRAVLKALTKQFFKSFFSIYAIYFFIKIPLICLQPMLIKNIVSFYKTPNNSSNSIYYNGLGLIFANLIIFCAFEHFTQRVKEISLQISIALASAVYRKSLRLKDNSVEQIGNVITLITKDVFKFGFPIILISDGLMYFLVLIYQSSSVVSKIGWIGGLLYIIPFMGVLVELVLARIAKNRRLQACTFSAQRLSLLKEAFSFIQNIKLNCWENFFVEKIDNLRNKEVQKLWVTFYIRIGNFIIGNLTSLTAFYATIFIYVLIHGKISADILFFIMSSTDITKLVFLYLFPYGLSRLAEILASMERIGTFLLLPESTSRNVFSEASNPMLILKSKSYDLNLQDKGLVIITGPIGSGKTALVKTIIKEKTSGDKTTVSIKGSISYAQQDPWLYPGTIRENILFGERYEEQRYRKILSICALNFDLDHLEQGDDTLILDDGLNLSKGQQVRINLARALYQNKQIYLLDSVLRQLDSITSRYVFHQAIRGFLNDKICLLITDDTSYCKYADYNVDLKLSRFTIRANENKNDNKNIINLPCETIFNPSDNFNGKNCNEFSNLLNPQLTSRYIYKEYNEKGKLLPSYYIRYMKFGGGFLIVFITLGCFIASEVCSIYSHKSMSTWINYEEKLSKINNFKNSNYNENRTAYESLVDVKTKTFFMYIIAFLLNVLFTLLAAYGFFSVTSTAAKKIHKNMLKCIMNAKMDFFCSNLLGVILNRFSKDINSIDETIPTSLYNTLNNIFKIIGIFFMIALSRWIFAVPISIIFLGAILILKFIFFPTIAKAKRLESALHSPMVGQLNATIKGISTIRVLEKDQNLLTKEFDSYQDNFGSAAFAVLCTNKGLRLLLSFTALLFLSIVVISFMLTKNASPGDVGLGIGKTLLFLQIASHILQLILELESDMTSMERLCQFLNVQQENRSGLDMGPKWPQHGSLHLNNVNLIYHSNNAHVLKNISFSIKAGEKLAIVGRTGGGKSSLISCLFRLYDYTGSIQIDGVDLKSLSLDYERSRFGIVSQDAFLFSGLTLRENIDPLNEYTNNQIEIVIDTLMKPFKAKLDLNAKYSDDMLSLGEKQMISLARILLSKKQIVIFDEVAANLDEATSIEIENIIRKHFKDKTVINIFHKLRNIKEMDKVGVLDCGRIVEFDSPDKLLGNSNSRLQKILMNDADVL